MKNDTVLVIGASGTVGSELIRILKATGQTVRAATSRKPQTAEHVQLNLVSGDGLLQAFEGVDKAFLLSPPGYSDHHAILSPLILEAKRRGLKKVVLMTAMGANLNEASAFRRAEVELEKSGLIYNIVRPNWFFQNFNTFWIQGIREQHQIALPAGGAKTSFIDARDISAVIAQLLLSNHFDNQALDLTGPEAIDHLQVAAEIGAAIGKKITYTNIEPQLLRNKLVLAGLPVDYIDFLIVIMGYLREGYNAGLTTRVKEVLGREPLSLSQYVQDYRKSWL